LYNCQYAVGGAKWRRRRRQYAVGGAKWRRRRRRQMPELQQLQQPREQACDTLAK
jgi:hypothetical protein